MLTHLYIDNYKAFVNFELHLNRIALLMGKNGTGKTGVLEVIGMIRRMLVEGARIDEVLSPTTLTRWDSRIIQTFEAVTEINEGKYTYRLEVEQGITVNCCRIRLERLQLDNQPLFEAELGSDNIYRVRLYRDDYSRGPEVLANWERSGISMLQPRRENQKLTAFRKAWEKLLTISIDPKRMLPTTEKEISSPAEDMANFASWFRTLVQGKPASIPGLFNDLKQVLDGFEELQLASFGETMRTIRVVLRYENGENGKKSYPTYEWAEISDGQKALIALYTLLHFAVGNGRTLIIDEPDNFLALAEIQPWLISLFDKVQTEDAQAILISHHPEIYDYLAADWGLVMGRESGGPIRVRAWKANQQASLKPSEIMARGWENE